MTVEQVALQVVDVFNSAGIPYALVGSFASNRWGIPRATKDADFVLQLTSQDTGRLWELFGGEFDLDPQLSFEARTGSRKLEMRRRDTPFTIELFLLSDDPHHQERFRRRVAVEVFGRTVWMPTAEDVIIQKLRWARPKDLDDARGVLAVQGGRLDRAYLEGWCDRHGTGPRLEELRRSIPEPGTEE
jgi:hypothetical protein